MITLTDEILAKPGLFFFDVCGTLPVALPTAATPHIASTGNSIYALI